MIFREHYLDLIKNEFEVHPVVTILGPRQVGKTTLAKEFAAKSGESTIHFDLENPLHLSRLENPSLALDGVDKLVIIDEVQLRPNLFSYLRYAVDNAPTKKFLVLGSASRDLINQSSQTLAGRIGYIELTPFVMTEVQETNTLFKRGGFPRSYLATTAAISMKWREGFIKTFIERDLSNLGIDVTTHLMEKLWIMLAHYHGNVLNYSELARSLQVSSPTVKKYAELLSECFMLRILKPWHANIGKRQVKLPKIYIRDSGLLHALLKVTDETMLFHPKLGAAWEGFALEEILNKYEYKEYYFWATHNDAEIDLVVIKDMEKIGYEFKYTDYPKITKSMQISMTDLGLSKINVIIPGKEAFKLAENIEVQGLDTLIN